MDMQQKMAQKVKLYFWFGIISRSMSRMLKQVQHDKDVTSLEMDHIPSWESHSGISLILCCSFRGKDQNTMLRFWSAIILNLFQYPNNRFKWNLNVCFQWKRKCISPWNQKWIQQTKFHIKYGMTHPSTYTKPFFLPTENVKTLSGCSFLQKLRDVIAFQKRRELEWEL